jgi:hypothetical protein
MYSCLVVGMLGCMANAIFMPDAHSAGIYTPLTAIRVQSS